MMGVCGSFMREDYDHHLQAVTNFNFNEFQGHPWMEDIG